MQKNYRQELVETCKAICCPGKGILAADESHGTIGKKVLIKF
jgi:fructose-bisphosphate aldolase class I